MKRVNKNLRFSSSLVAAAFKGSHSEPSYSTLTLQNLRQRNSIDSPRLEEPNEVAGEAKIGNNNHVVEFLRCAPF